MTKTLTQLLDQAFSSSPEKYQRIGFREAYRIKTTKSFSPNEHVGYQVDAFVRGAYSAEKILRPLFDAAKRMAKNSEIVAEHLLVRNMHAEANTLKQDLANLRRVAEEMKK